MNVCEGIDLKKYMENDISFNSINSDTKFGECFLRDVAENELEGLSKTSVNCIYKSFIYKRVGVHDEIYFIKIQMNEYADSLEEEARILSILNANTNLRSVQRFFGTGFLEGGKNATKFKPTTERRILPGSIRSRIIYIYRGTKL